MTDDRDPEAPDEDRLDLGAWTAPLPPADLTARVLDRVRAGAAAGAIDPAGARRRVWPALVAAGGLLAAAAGVAYLLRPRAERPASGHVVAAGPSTVQLAGGSEALLTAGAELDWRRDGAGIAVAQLAGAITYRHRGLPLVVTTPGGIVRTDAASFHVEVPMKKQLIAGATGVAIVAAVIVAVYDGRADVEAPVGTTPTVVEAGGQVAMAIPATTRPGPRPVPVARATKDRARRDEVAAAIAAARAGRPAGGATRAGTPGAPAPAPGGAVAVDDTPGELTKDEIRSGVRETVPLLVECYTMALEADPTLQGTVTAKLHVDNEPGIGMVVTMVDSQSTMGSRPTAGGADPVKDFNDCFSATLESVVLPPLAEGGHVEIDYPFIFRPTDEEEATIPAPRRSTDDLIVRTETAAREGQWTTALTLAEATLLSSAEPALRVRAVTAATLAACNLKDSAAAVRHAANLPPGRHRVIAQRCAQNGVKLPALAVSSPAPTTPAAIRIPPSALEQLRVAGEHVILPDEATMLAIDRVGSSFVVPIEVCIDATGAVTGARIMKASDHPAYDQTLVESIRGTWRFRPHVVSGQPTPACTTASFSVRTTR